MTPDLSDVRAMFEDGMESFKTGLKWLKEIEKREPQGDPEPADGGRD